MAGYLDHYGEGDERRARVVKTIVAVVMAVAIITGAVALFLHNRSEENQVKRFLSLIKAGDYKTAYALWGCTDAQPCRDYPMKSFMEDWGPQAVPPGDFRVLDGDSCGSGVIVDTDLAKAGDRKIWVEKSNQTLGFPPYAQCPQRNRIADFVRNLKYRLHGRTYQ
jgi:hypothetical protein